MYRKLARYATFAYAHNLGVIPVTVWYDVRYTNEDPDVDTFGPPTDIRVLVSGVDMNGDKHQIDISWDLPSDVLEMLKAKANPDLDKQIMTYEAEPDYDGDY